MRPLLSITFPQGFPKLKKKFGHLTVGSGGKKRLNGTSQDWTHKKKVILHSFSVKVFKSETTSFHYFSPSILKIKQVWTLDFRKHGKKMFKRHLSETTPIPLPSKKIYFSYLPKLQFFYFLQWSRHSVSPVYRIEREEKNTKTHIKHLGI